MCRRQFPESAAALVNFPLKVRPGCLSYFPMLLGCAPSLGKRRPGKDKRPAWWRRGLKSRAQRTRARGERVTDGSGHTLGSVPARSEIPADGAGAGASSAPKRTSVKLRLADGSATDCRAGIHLARDAHLRTIFQDAISPTNAITSLKAIGKLHCLKDFHSRHCFQSKKMAEFLVHFAISDRSAP